MNDSHPPENTPAGATPDDMRSALFAHMVMQQSSMAMMLLGKTPHPETGQIVRDFEAARFFIDQLEMLEIKTKGNLTQDEAALLKQSLMSLHMAFVEAVDSPAPPAAPAPAPGSPPAPAAADAPTGHSAETPAAAPDEAESRKKFTKKY